MDKSDHVLPFELVTHEIAPHCDRLTLRMLLLVSKETCAAVLPRIDVAAGEALKDLAAFGSAQQLALYRDMVPYPNNARGPLVVAAVTHKNSAAFHMLLSSLRAERLCKYLWTQVLCYAGTVDMFDWISQQVDTTDWPITLDMLMELRYTHRLVPRKAFILHILKNVPAWRRGISREKLFDALHELLPQGAGNDPQITLDLMQTILAATHAHYTRHERMQLQDAITACPATDATVYETFGFASIPNKYAWIRKAVLYNNYNLVIWLLTCPECADFSLADNISLWQVATLAESKPLDTRLATWLLQKGLVWDQAAFMENYVQPYGLARWLMFANAGAPIDLAACPYIGSPEAGDLFKKRNIPLTHSLIDNTLHNGIPQMFEWVMTHAPDVLATFTPLEFDTFNQPTLKLIDWFVRHVKGFAEHAVFRKILPRMDRTEFPTVETFLYFYKYEWAEIFLKQRWYRACVLADNYRAIEVFHATMQRDKRSLAGCPPLRTLASSPFLQRQFEDIAQRYKLEITHTDRTLYAEKDAI